MSEHVNKATAARIAELRAWAFPRLLRLGRAAGVGMVAGAIAGVLVGGASSRIVMRIVALVGGKAISGLETENGNIVGQVTTDGTIGLIIFAGVFAGIVGGILFVAVRRWLPGSKRWHGLAFGLLLMLVFSTIVIDSDNADFSRFGPPALSIGLFAVLFILFGVAVAPLAAWCDRWLPAASSRRAPVVVAYVLLAILALLFIVEIIGFGFGSPLGLVLLLIFVLALVPTRERSGRIVLASGPRPIATALGYLLMAAPCVAGLVLGVKAVVNIL